MRCRVHCALLAVMFGGAPACSLTANLDHLSAGGGAGESGAAGGAAGAGGGAGSGAAAAGGSSAAGASGSGGEPSGGTCRIFPSNSRLLPNGGVELGVDAAPPNHWSAFGGTVTEEMTYVHAGNAAALVCSNQEVEDVFSAYSDIAQLEPLEAGQVYTASACIRAHPERAPPNSIRLVLREHSGATTTDANSPPLSDLGEAWQKLDVTLIVSETATDWLNVILAAENGAGGPCFIFDDVQVARSK